MRLTPRRHVTRQVREERRAQIQFEIMKRKQQLEEAARLRSELVRLSQSQQRHQQQQQQHKQKQHKQHRQQRPQHQNTHHQSNAHFQVSSVIFHWNGVVAVMLLFLASFGLLCDASNFY